jgi:hypothetical protein
MQLAQHLGELILFLVILVGPLPLAFSLILIDSEGKEPPNLPHYLLVLLTSWCVIETCIGLLLGTIKHLELNSVLVSEFVVFLAGILLLIYLRRNIPFFFFYKFLRLGQRLNNFETLIIGSVSFVGVIILERLMTLPITEYDSLWWKLPVTVRFYQTASVTWLNAVDHPNLPDQEGLVRNTFDWHVLCSVFLMPFREDFLVTFPMLIAWLILGLSVYLLSIKVGAMRIYAMAASVLVLTVPLCLNGVNTMHIDMPFASFFMASLYFAFSCNQTRSPSQFLLFLASIGMLLGIKTSGLIYVFLLVAVFIIMKLAIIFLSNKDNSSLFIKSRFTIPLVTMGILALLLLGGFWYFNNLIEFGNPLGDVGVKIANITVFPGKFDYTEVKQVTLANRFDPTNPSHWNFLGLQAFFRLQIPFIGMLAQVLVLPYAFRIRQKQIRNETLIGLVALLINTGLLYWNTPFSAGAPSDYLSLAPTELSPTTGHSMRYGFSFLGVLGVVAATSASVTRTRPRIVVVIVLISSLLGIVTSTLIDASQIAKFKGESIRGAVIVDRLRHAPEEAMGLILNIVKTDLLQVVLYTVIYLLVISLICWGFFGKFNRTQFVLHGARILKQSGRWVVVSIFIGLIVTATFVARDKRDIQRHEIYGGTYEYISSNIGQDETIGYLLNDRSYLFYGKELNKKVLYTPAKTDNLSEWLDDLRQRGISLVAVGPVGSNQRGASREVSWLENADGPFIPVFGQDLTRETVLYRFKGSLRRRTPL